MPWQRLVADVAGELVEYQGTNPAYVGTLVPAYREVVFTVPRQNGKTTLVLPWEVQRAIGWTHLGPQRIAYTAQTGQDARKKIVEDQFPLLEKAAKSLGIRLPFHRTPGIVGVSWNNKSRLIEVASTPDAGHGQTFDLAVKDELFADDDDRRDQALRPAMITKPAAQVIACSTMGTDDSVPWNALVARGRAAVEAQKRSGIAYFEWSAPHDADPADPETWWACMPGMGWSIDEATIQLEWEAKRDDENEFRRPYLNQQTTADARVIPQGLWNAVCDPAAQPDGSVVFALDSMPDRSSSCIVACSSEDMPVVELIDQRPDVTWLIERAVELDERHPGSWFVVERRSPAGSLIPELEDAGVMLKIAESADVPVASGLFFDGVIDATFRVRSHPAFDGAAAGVVKQPVGDAFKWSRKSSSVDISPLVAATLALWVARSDSSLPMAAWR